MIKKDIIKSSASILIIIVLAVVIVNVNKFISPKAPQTAEESQGVLSESNPVDYGECFNKDPSTIIFVHSNSCPHCIRMKPIVTELEGEGHKFYWAESSDIESRELISNCFSDLIGGYVPQFICPATGKEQTGAMNKEELKTFSDNCR